MAGYIGIDTHFLDKQYVRNGEPKRFRSLVGVGVSTRDIEGFVQAYKQAIQRTLDTCGISSNKSVLSNFDFLKLYEECGKPIHQIFFKEIASHIESVNVFYTLLDPAVKMRWMGHKEKELQHKLARPYLEFEEILNKLNNSFPAICVWRIQNFLRENKISCLLDHFSVQPSDAWYEIRDMDLNLFFSGDQCNPLIATADVIIKLLELRLARERLFYQYGNFRRVLPELEGKVYEYSISHRHYQSISPLHNKHINLRTYIKHPVFFVLNESDFMPSSELKTDRSLDPVYNLAMDQFGSVKIFNKKEDKRIIQKGDYVAYFTDYGKRFVDQLKGMGRKVNGLHLGDL